MTTAMKLDPITAYVRRLDKPYYLQREAAAALGITPNRLHILGVRFPETLGPGFVTWVGAVKIFLYLEKDLDQVRAYFAHLEATRPSALEWRRGGPGRPPLWNPEEHADRHRRHSLARYHLVASQRLTAQGQVARAKLSLARATALKKSLREQATKRKASLTPEHWF
jgi:hypothetical protein